MKYISVKEAAKILHITEARVYKMAEKRILKKQENSKFTRIDAEYLRDYMSGKFKPKTREEIVNEILERICT